MINFTTVPWDGLAPALKSRNFRLFWLAQIVSTIGTSLQVVAEGWLIYQVTESTLWLGLVGFFGLLPVVPISLLGGVLIDRVSRRRLIMLTQCGLLLQALLFAWMATHISLTPWHLVGVYFVFGALIAVDHPARRAFLVELVEADDLANAVALNASLFNVSHLVGFAVSGFLLASIGAGGTMTLNGLSYLLPIWALSQIRVQERVWSEEIRPSLQTALSEGVLTLWHKPAVLGVMGLMAVCGGLAWPVFGLMPAFAEEVLLVNTVGLGFLLAAGTAGSLLGTTVVAKMSHKTKGRNLMGAAIALPVVVTFFAHSSGMGAALASALLVGVVLIVVQSLAITLVQLHISDQVRGRVMSLYSMVHAGADTMSNVVVGAAAVSLGLPLALTFGAGVALLFGLVVVIFLPVLRQLD